MVNGHSGVGIAQISFFAPYAFAAAYLSFARRERHRVPWYFLFIFSLVRVVTGILVILHQEYLDNAGLTAAATVLLAVGVVSLLIAKLGLIQIILESRSKATTPPERPIALLRILLIISISLIVAGGSIEGANNTMSLIQIGRDLVKAGYIVVAVIAAALIVFQAYLFQEQGRHHLAKSSNNILIALAITDIFLIIRIIYSFLSLFDISVDDYTWSPLFGSVAAFAIMVLCTEIVIVGVFLAVGFSIPVVSRIAQPGGDDA